MYIISEIFPQHGGSMHVAEQMILQSKLAGADAVKVQLYTATQFGAERSYLELSYEGLKHLKQYADNLRVDLFATPFTMERLQWCIDLKLPYLKVAARMHKEMPELVDAIMQQAIPTFVSVPEDYNLTELKLYDHATYLYCILKYPTRLDEISFPDFENSIFSGVSDHTLGNAAALYASAHGATHLEKHFTLRKSFQFETEKAHLGSMTMEDLIEIKNTAREFEIIRNTIRK
jgi:N,N'-diacetyllegionaminate synthase